MSTAKPFRVAVDQTVVDDLPRRLAAARLPRSPEKHGWNEGVDLSWLAEVITYWRDGFDWRAQETRLLPFSQVTGRDGRHFRGFAKMKLTQGTMIEAAQ